MKLTKIMRLFAIATIFAAGATISASDYDGLLNTYRGTIESGDGTIPITTDFFESENESVGGTYILNETDGDTEGSLELYGKESDEVYVFIWTDVYGSGYVRMLFSSDRKSFTAYWGDTLDELLYPWSGAAIPHESLKKKRESKPAEETPQENAG